MRFGDPEAQAVIPRLKTDLVPVMLEIAEGKLKITGAYYNLDSGEVEVL